MSSTPPPFDPFKFYAAMAATMLEATKSAQEAYIGALETAAQSKTLPLTMMTVEVPVFSMPAMDETQMRDLFQGMADKNLSRWENTANLLSATPEWVRWQYAKPGEALTDMFDKIRRRQFGMMPAANDAGPPPEATKTPASGPSLLDGPDGTPDDLTAIKGIGPKLSGRLNDLGIYHFSQIADWRAADAEWIDDKLAFKGRVAREKWIQQARKLAKASAA